MVSIVKIASAHQSPFGMTDSKDGEEGNVTNIFVSTAKLFHTFQDTLAMLPLEQRILFLRPPL
jgi:hypothetical protein